MYCTFHNHADNSRIDISDLTIRVESYTHNAIGGPSKAFINVTGATDRLYTVLTMLAADVVIYDERSSPRWWGFIEHATITLGALSFGFTLQKLANQIRVTYTEHTLDEHGQEQQRQTFTDWLGDSESIAAYGIHEAILAFGDSTQEAANSYRDVILNSSSRPVDTLELAFNGTKREAVLECKGYWDTTSWRYFKEDLLTSGSINATPVVYAPLKPGSFPQPIRLGQRIYPGANEALAAVQFIVQKIGDQGGNPTGFLRCELWYGGTSPTLGPGNVDWPTTRITSVNVPLSVLGDDGARPSFTVTSIPVASNVATVTQTAHGLSEGDSIEVYGASLDYVNGISRVTSVPDADTFKYKATGANGTATGIITINYGVDPPPAAPATVTWNFPNAPLSNTLANFVVLSLDGGTFADGRYINVACSVNGGPVVGTPFGQSRAGVRGFDTGTWQPNYIVSDAYDLLYSVVLTRQTTDLIAERVASHAHFIKDTLIEQPSGIYTSTFEDGQSRLQNVLEDLLATGSATAARMLARVNQDTILIVYPEPLKTDDPAWLYDPITGTLGSTNGVLFDLSTCPCGSWAEISGVPAAYFQRTGRSIFVTTWQDAAIGATALAILPLTGTIPAGTRLYFPTANTYATATAPAAAGATTLAVEALTDAIATGDSAIYGVSMVAGGRPRIFIEESTYTPATKRLEITARGATNPWHIGS